jgi:hypothetical protein
MPRQKIELTIDDVELPEVDEGFTVRDAQKIVEYSIKEGVKTSCKCCGRVVTRYQRKLSSILVARLITFAVDYLNDGGDEPVKIPTKPGNKTCNFEDLTHWGFVTTGKDKEGGGRGIKVAKLTKAGYDFIIGNDDAPLHLFFFDNNTVGESVADVDVDDALGDDYDYFKLIKNCEKLVAETQVD